MANEDHTQHVQELWMLYDELYLDWTQKGQNSVHERPYIYNNTKARSFPFKYALLTVSYLFTFKPFYPL